MSGHKKTVIAANVSNEEYRQKHELEMKKLFSFEINQDFINNLDENYQQVVQRQNDFKDTIANYDDHIRIFENKISQDILDYQLKINNSFDQESEKLLDQTIKIISEQAGYFKSEMDKYQQELTLQVNEEFADIRQKEVMKQEIASSWIEYVVSLIKFITDNYPHEQLTPGRIQEITNRLDVIESNYNNLMYEAALVDAQKLYFELSELRVFLENSINEWQLLHQTAWEYGANVYNVAMNSRSVPAVDFDGNELDIAIDVDYWSSRKLYRFIERIVSLLNELESNNPPLDIQAIKNILENVLPEMEKELTNISYQAKMAVLNSQIRVNIADIVVQALEDQGFVLAEYSYNHNDMRKGYFANVKNIAGSEVIVTVDPHPGKPEAYDLNLKSYDKEPKTEHELRQRTKEITRSLSHYGLNIGPIDVVRENSSYDVEELRKEKQKYLTTKN